MDLKEMERTALGLEQQSGTLKRLSGDMRDLSVAVKRSPSLLSIGITIEKEADSLDCLFGVLEEMEEVLTLAALFQRQAEQRILQQYEGERLAYFAPAPQTVDFAEWKILPEDIRIL